MTERLYDQILLDSPVTLNATDYQTTMRVTHPLNTVKGSAELPFLPNDRMTFGLQNATDELVDMSASYLTFAHQITCDTTITPASFPSTFTNNVIQFPMLSAGLPFVSMKEYAGNTLINFTQDRLNRFSTLGMLCNAKGLSGGSYESMGNITAPVGMGTVLLRCIVYPIYSIVSNAYSDLINNVFIRSRFLAAKCSDGSYGVNFKSYVCMPLRVISRLASSRYLCPVGLMSQNNPYGVRFELQICPIDKLYVIPATIPRPDVSNISYQLTQARVVTRVLKILNQSVMTDLLNQFNRLPIAIGDELMVKNISLPFNNTLTRTDYVQTGERVINVDYNLQLKNLKGCMIRFVNNTFLTDLKTEKNLGDCNLLWKNIYFKFGDQRFPADIFDNLDFTGNQSFNTYSKIFNKEGQALWDPEMNPGQGANTLDFMSNILVNSPYMAFNSFVFDFRNVMLHAPDGSNYATGVNTYDFNNTVTLVIELHSNLTEQLQIETAWMYQDSLMIGDGTMVLAYEKEIINNANVL